LTDIETRADRVVKQILESLLDTIEEERAALHTRESVEAVHQFRVAIRKTRSVAAQLPDAFEKADLDYCLSEFKWIAVVTGPIRDIDVFLERINAYEATGRSGNEGALNELKEWLRSERVAAMAQLDKAVRSRRYQTLMARWRGILARDSGRLSSEADALPVERAATGAIGRAHRVLMRRAIALLADQSFEVTVVHRLRISCKKLRYLLEAFADVLGQERVAGLIEVQKRVQDGAGGFHDLVLQRMRLSAFRSTLESTADDQLGPDVGGALEDLDAWLATELLRVEAELRAALAEFIGPESTRRFEHLLGGLPEGEPETVASD